MSILLCKSCYPHIVIFLNIQGYLRIFLLGVVCSTFGSAGISSAGVITVSGMFSLKHKKGSVTTNSWWSKITHVCMYTWVSRCMHLFPFTSVNVFTHIFTVHKIDKEHMAYTKEWEYTSKKQCKIKHSWPWHHYDWQWNLSFVSHSPEAQEVHVDSRRTLLHIVMAVTVIFLPKQVHILQETFYPLLYDCSVVSTFHFFDANPVHYLVLEFYIK